MFGWMFKKNSENDIEPLKEEIKTSFNHVKNDVTNISKWVKHLNEQDSKKEAKFMDIDARLSSIENDIEGIKNSISLMDLGMNKKVFKTPVPVYDKQASVEGVYSAVQTAVQTGEISLNNLSSMERATVFILLNSDMKLSYDDLAAMMGKSRATIRGQVNSIKQKCEGLLEEIIEKSGKKRVFIREEIKEKLLKNVKVRVNKRENKEKKWEEE